MRILIWIACLGAAVGVWAKSTQKPPISSPSPSPRQPASPSEKVSETPSGTPSEKPASVASGGASLKADPGPSWKLVSNKDGAATYERSNPQDRVIYFRGVTVFDFPIARILAVLLDAKRAHEWTENLKSSRIVKWIHQPTEYIEYDHMGTPIVVKDRDFVSHVTIKINRPEQMVTIRYDATEVPEEPLTKYVRGDLTGSELTLKSVEGGKKTAFDGVVHADPKGSVPKWLVNYFQRSWMHDTILAIRKQAKKPDIVDHAYFKNALEGPLPSPSVSPATASAPRVR